MLPSGPGGIFDLASRGTDGATIRRGPPAWPWMSATCTSAQRRHHETGGERGIRTPEARFRRLHTFQACSFNHSDTSPCLSGGLAVDRSGILAVARGFNKVSLSAARKGRDRIAAPQRNRLARAPVDSNTSRARLAAAPQVRRCLTATPDAASRHRLPGSARASRSLSLIHI